MPLANNRATYSWPKTELAEVKILPERREVKADDTLLVTLNFKVVGGLRESYNPDVWTVAWEENDKLIRLMMDCSLSVMRGGLLPREIAKTGRIVRKGRFYWSRDPDLPYRIWTAIIHEDGSAPIIPLNVEDAKSKLFDVAKTFRIPGSALGKGQHTLVGSVSAKWGRRSYIEKGEASARSAGVAIMVN